MVKFKKSSRKKPETIRVNPYQVTYIESGGKRPFGETTKIHFSNTKVAVRGSPEVVDQKLESGKEGCCS